MPSSLNGTGVTFNDGSTLQSGNIPTANMGSGTANSSTFLRGDRTFATVPASAPSTDQVLSAYAGAAYGAVGTHTAAYGISLATDTEVAAGSTTAGSNLRRTNTNNNNSIGGTNVASEGATTALGLAGTWRVMMPLRNASGSPNRVGGLWLRIS